ncbi:MAG: hypothetical protein R2830_27235, partial [Saprospiraceae bacterium]
KPILLGIEGEAKSLFIDEGKAGWAFEPENEASLAACVLDVYHHREQLITAGRNGAAYVKEHFEREKIAKDFWQFINN